MTQFTTELLNFLAQKQDIDEFFLTSLETAMNGLLQAELSAFLGDEPYEKVGYNSGNSRNGIYLQKFETKYGTVQLTVPRYLRTRKRNRAFCDCRRHSNGACSSIR